MDNQTLLFEANRSFKMAQEYEPESLDSQRDSFYKKFLKANSLTIKDKV